MFYLLQYRILICQIQDFQSLEYIFLVIIFKYHLWTEKGKDRVRVHIISIRGYIQNGTYTHIYG